MRDCLNRKQLRSDPRLRMQRLRHDDRNIMSTTDNSTTLQAADPGRNATVHASAGTGKTWLLVTRILRLLLAGARPDSILAVTFTRKAAAEMQQRVTERLRELMCADERSLDKMLDSDRHPAGAGTPHTGTAIV